MVLVDTIAALHPYLQFSPLVESTADSLGWFSFVSAPDEWHQDDHRTTVATMVDECIGGSFCKCFVCSFTQAQSL
jgi:hypothetical protein